MEYRTLPHGGEQIGIIGMGTSSVGMAGVAAATETFAHAIECGVNYFDFASADAVPFSAMGAAAQGVRDRLYYQVHFGATYETGAYGWTCDLGRRSGVRSTGSSATLRTDYIDFGFIHCIDEEADLRKGLSGRAWSITSRGSRRQGVVRHIGLSTHTPAIANSRCWTWASSTC